MRGVGLTIIVLLTAVFGCAQPVQTVRVRIYDYSGIEPRTLEIAKLEAGKRLSEAGIGVEWMDCQSHVQPVNRERCNQPFTPTDFILNLLPRGMAARFGQPKNALAFAAVSGEPGADREFWVFYDAIRRLGEQAAPTATIVGDVVAHELAHLLLDSAQHADNGIMRGAWSAQSLREASCGQLRFSAEVIAGMREGLNQRSLQSANQPAPSDQQGGSK